MNHSATREPLNRAFQIGGFALLAFGVYLAAAIVSWEGIGDWDGMHYIRGALLWVENGPSLGRDHWELRYPLVLPMAAAIEFAGRSELSASVPNFVYGGLLVLMSVVIGERFLAPRAGLFLGLLVASSPALALLPLEIEIRGPEIFLAVLSLWMFLEGLAREDRKAAWFLLGAGLASGLAWMCREVAGYLPVVFVAAAYLLAPRGRRLAACLLPVSAFAATIAFELALYAVADGDPLYRYKTDMGHGVGRGGTSFASTITGQDNVLGIAGVALKPLSLRVAEMTTGPFFIAGLLAALLLVVKQSRLSRAARHTLVVFGVAAVLSYALAAMILDLKLPLYFPMLDYLALVLIALAAAALAIRGYVTVSYAAVGSVCMAGVFITDLRRDYEFDACRAAAEVAIKNDAPVVTSDWIRERAEIVLRLQGMSAAAAAAEFADVSQARSGDIGFLPSQRWLAPADLFGPDWMQIGETRPALLSWSHRLLVAVAAVVPLPDRVIRKAAPLPGTIYRLRGPTVRSDAANKP